MSKQALLLAQRALSNKNASNKLIYEALAEVNKALNKPDGVPKLIESIQVLIGELRWWEDEHSCCKGSSDDAISKAYAVIAEIAGAKS
jgi:hypothetical protein